LSGCASPFWASVREGANKLMVADARMHATALALRKIAARAEFAGLQLRSTPFLAASVNPPMGTFRVSASLVVSGLRFFVPRARFLDLRVKSSESVGGGSQRFTAAGHSTTVVNIRRGSRDISAGSARRLPASSTFGISTMTANSCF
jgi:hypothetical protein